MTKLANILIEAGSLLAWLELVALVAVGCAVWRMFGSLGNEYG